MKDKLRLKITININGPINFSKCLNINYNKSSIGGPINYEINQLRLFMKQFGETVEILLDDKYKIEK